MNHVEGRLLKMGFSMETIEKLSIEDRTYLATGLTRYVDVYYDNPWYTPGGAANVSDTYDMNDPRIDEILERLSKIEAELERLKDATYDDVTFNNGVMDVTDIK